MRLFKVLLPVLASLSAICGLHASELDSIRYRVEGQASLSSGANTPFWLVNNRKGLSSIRKNNGYLRAGVFKDIDPSARLSWGAGADLALAYRFTSTFIVQQLYGELKYRAINVLVGSKELHGEIANPRLSSGELLYSGNARPIPQLRAGFFHYVPVPLTKDWLAVKGYVAYGMFTDDNWQKDFAAPGSKHTEHVLYHSKGIWFRGGNTDRFPLTFELGLEMAAQFGGKSITGDKVIDMPNKFKDVIKVFWPSSGDGSTPMGEQTNVYGNHVGSWTFAFSWLPKQDWAAKVYYQHYFEDHSMMFFDYTWKDCLLGFEVTFPKNRWISGAVYEYLYTKDQSGPVYWDHTPEIPEQVSGRDEYYNHYLYTGWQHWGMGIGNPLLISPIYNRDGLIRFKSTRLIGHHIGFMGQPWREVGYRVLLSYTRNWGTYSIPFAEVMDNVNGLLEINYSPRKLKGWTGVISLGADGGDLLGKSLGAMLTIRKTGWL